MLALGGATPMIAQQRGMAESGAFGSAASFDQALTLKTGDGGGRVGIFLTPRVSLEYEGALMKVSRTNGLTSVNMGLLSGRLVMVPVKAGGLSLLLGAG